MYKRQYVFHFKWTVFDPANNDPPEGNTTDGRVGIRIDYVLEGAEDNTIGNPTSSIASLNKTFFGDAPPLFSMTM